MSRKIARLLDETERSITKLIKELEVKNGFPSHDARLLAGNSQQFRRKLDDLGLDPDDTTAQELYSALLVRFEKNSVLIEHQFATAGLSFDARAAKAGLLTSENFQLPQRWAMKSATARNLLRQLPPKHLMKYLKYRSVDSMLKRERTAELYLAAGYTEPAIWQKNLNRLVSKLAPTDLELRKIQIISMESEKWSGIDGPETWLTASDDVASMAIWPAAEIHEAPLLFLTLLLVDGLELPLKHRPAKLLSQTSGILEWWAETDYLLAEIDGHTISLNLLDMALNSFWQNDFDDREIRHGRTSFWKELVSRYENLPPAEALFEETTRQQIVRLRQNIPQPVFELAEDEFDG